MLPTDVLIKAITLLYREKELSLIEDTSVNNSVDLVRNIVNIVDNSERNKLYGGSSDIIDNLKHFIIDFTNNIDNYDKFSLLQSLELILKDKPQLFKIIDKTLNTELTKGGLKRTIISLRNNLNTYHKEQEIKKTISKTSYLLTTNADNKESVMDIAVKLLTNLEALTTKTKTKDPAIMDEVDFDNEDEAGVVLDKLKGGEGGVMSKLLCGWSKINTMTQGGFRRGEMAMFDALQHNYKSGFVRSIFMQLPRYNKPVMLDANKKPLMLFISLEDDMDIILEHMYVYLYYNENLKMPDMTTLKGKEVVKYIRDQLSASGYQIKILRVNPSEWTYRDFFNKILEFEADGFEIHACFADYLSKLPTTGCITNGPMGTDLRDLFNKFRNFFAAKRIFFGTPHQLSTEAKQLKRNGVLDQDLPKEVAGKGYTEGSKQLDQVVDLELYLNIAYIKKTHWLCVGRGKHRIPTIIDDKDKYCRLRFPYKAPILEDKNDPNFNKDSDGGDNEEFDF